MHALQKKMSFASAKWKTSLAVVELAAESRVLNNKLDKEIEEAYAEYERMNRESESGAYEDQVCHCAIWLSALFSLVNAMPRAWCVFSPLRPRGRMS